MIHFRFYCHWQAFGGGTFIALRAKYGLHPMDFMGEWEGQYNNSPYYRSFAVETLKKGFEILKDLKAEEEQRLPITKITVNGLEVSEILPSLIEAIESSIAKLKSGRGKQPSRKEAEVRRLLQKSIAALS
jgi:hypothetical protein